MAVAMTYSMHVPDTVSLPNLGVEHYERVKFLSLDTVISRSMEITAVWYPNQLPSDCKLEWLRYRSQPNLNATVIAQHGLGASALRNTGGSAVPKFAVKPLLCAGFSVLSPDLRNHGHSSDAKPVSSGYHEAYDVLAAAQWLADRGVGRDRIYLWGESLGAASVAYAAAWDPRFRSLAIEAPPASTGLVYGGFGRDMPHWMRYWMAWWHKSLSLDAPYDESLLREARFIAADVLHSHGRDDEIVPFVNAEALRRALEVRAPVVDAHTARIRRPSYKYFWHPGPHISSWQYPEYFGLMLGHFSAAAAAAANSSAGLAMTVAARLDEVPRVAAPPALASPARVQQD